MPQLGYGFFPTWAMWQIDRYLGLDADQRALVSRNLDDLHDWHKQSQLPEYAAFLHEVDVQLRQPVDAADIGAWRERIKAIWPPIAARLAPPMAQLLATVRPEQVARMQQRITESNQKLRSEYLPVRGKSRETARADRIIERAEFFLGSLSGPQEAELRKQAADLPATEESFLDEREARQRAFIKLVDRFQREQPAPQAAEKLCHDYLVSLWQGRDAGRRARLDQREAAEDSVSAALLSRATDAQRSYLSSKLLGFAQDFTKLAGAAK